MDISALPIAPIGASALIAVVVLLILRGALVPRAVHEDRMRDKDRQIDYLQTSNAELIAQNSALLEVGHTAEKVLVSLREAVDFNEEGPREVAPS